jgi:hypothetical protein
MLCSHDVDLALCRIQFSLICNLLLFPRKEKERKKKRKRKKIKGETASDFPQGRPAAMPSQSMLELPGCCVQLKAVLRQGGEMTQTMCAHRNK